VRAQGRRRGGDAELGCGAWSGSVRARGWFGRGEGDDRRVPPGSETRGEGGGVGRAGPLVGYRKLGCARVKNELCHGG
jgi:hypothetical protein